MKISLLITFLFCSRIVTAQLVPFYAAALDKYGYKDLHGEVVITPKYDFAWSFNEGMSPMKLNGKYGYVNDRGVEVVPPTYDNALKFSDGLAVVKVGDKFGFIDKTGKLVVPAIYDRADIFHGDRANVCLKRKWSVMIYQTRK